MKCLIYALKLWAAWILWMLPDICRGYFLLWHQGLINLMYWLSLTQGHMLSTPARFEESHLLPKSENYVQLKQLNVRHPADGKKILETKAVINPLGFVLNGTSNLEIYANAVFICRFTKKSVLFILRYCIPFVLKNNLILCIYLYSFISLLTLKNNFFEILELK